MGFSEKEAEKLLVACHRRCCVCHRFCGVKMELDHIEPRAISHDDSIENAIPVCFECHAETHAYNNDHPRGRKFRPAELRAHKDQWLELCRKRPEMFAEELGRTDAGPLQSLCDELEFDIALSRNSRRPGIYEPRSYIGCRYLDEQFRLVISEGVFAMLKDELKDALTQAYMGIGQLNSWLATNGTPDWEANSGQVDIGGIELEPILLTAKAQLLRFLGREEKVAAEESLLRDV